MRVRLCFAIALALLICNSARSDTITLNDNESINGSILGMSDGVLKLSARFPSGEKLGQIPISNIQSIEFNKLTYNTTAPSKVMGFGPAHPVAMGVTIVLKGGEKRETCILATIDADSVHCKSKDVPQKDASYDRTDVLRIEFSTK
jgi:hypothetical protein